MQRPRNTINELTDIDFKSDVQGDLLSGLEPSPKKLVTLKLLLIFISLIIATMLLDMHFILAPLPMSQQDKIAFLAGFTIFIVAPFASLVLSFIVALIPLKQYSYIQRVYFFGLLILLIVEIALLIITLVEK